jgi:hypothetical protein
MVKSMENNFSEIKEFPRMYHVRQVLDAPRVADIEETVLRELNSTGVGSLVQPGARIAVTVGSRGIANIVPILKNLVAFLRSFSAEPFLVTAMGSHGGGTSKGQREILESLGITEDAVGAPIISSMEVVEIGKSRYGFPVYADKHAAESDGIVVVNRVKPHTDFEGPVESGLMKMMAIGLGNLRGCVQVHRQAVQFGYRSVIPEIGGLFLKTLPVLFGIGIVENAYHETALIRVASASNLLETEKELLVAAKRLMCKLPFDDLDVLVVDEIGKNISGSGTDTNVIGRIMFVGEKEPERPKITRIVVLDLTPECHGNAIGVGLADYTTQRLLHKINFRAMASNAIAAMTPEKGRVPIALQTDKKAVAAALKTIRAVAPKEARVVHIRDTLHMWELDISEALLPEAEARKNLEVIREMGPLSFDEEDFLEPVVFGEHPFFDLQAHAEHVPRDERIP